VKVDVSLTVQVGERNFVRLNLGGETKLRPQESVDQAQDRLFEALELTLNTKIDEYVTALQ